MTDLSVFLKQKLADRAPWNCSTMASDWCVANGYPDFAVAWRSVVDQSVCDTAAEAGGGLLALWDKDIGTGLPPADEPQRGDIAVVEAMGMQAGAIFTGERWAIQASRTLHFLAPDQVRVIKAWRL